MASGRLKFLGQPNKKTQDVSKIRTKEEEKQRFLLAKKRTLLDIDKMYERARTELGGKEAEIFEIHKMLLCDEDLNEIIILEIEHGASAENAIESSASKYIEMLIALNDPYLSARGVDIMDLSTQLVNNLCDDKTEKIDTSPCILVANDLTPSQTMMLDKSLLLGFVTFEGSVTSHTSILARAMDIPALVGTGKIDSSYDGAIALLDAKNQRLIVNPSASEILEFEKERTIQIAKKRKEREQIQNEISKPAIAKNGHRVLVYANIGTADEVNSALENGAEGIGLLRSELLYLSRGTLPSEDELFESYKSVITKMQGRRVIIRTLDVGADKKIPYLGLASEENPALGLRGIRVCLQNKDLFKTQIRAILRASAYGKASIMLPMIISKGEVLESRALIEECKHELFDENQAFDSKIELGIMIETPSSAIMCNELASVVDFFSVGTNDLIQYTLAIDRQNPSVAHLTNDNLEPVLRLIRNCADAIHRHGGFIGICGELASYTSLTSDFVDMQIDELSVSTPFLIDIRRAISQGESNV